MEITHSGSAEGLNQGLSTSPLHEALASLIQDFLNNHPAAGLAGEISPQAPTLNGTAGHGATGTTEELMAAPASSSLPIESYDVPGLGERKQAILDAGGGAFEIALAMHATETMDAESYPWKDGKEGDAANYGIFKQNEGMITEVYPFEWGASGSDLNNDLQLDIQVLQDARAHFGDDWWAGQIGGQSGLDGDWPQQEIDDFRRSVEGIAAQIQSNPETLTDDTRFWVDTSQPVTPPSTSEPTEVSQPTPVPEPAFPSGTQHVEGLGERKQEILAAGGDSIALAVAMLETDTINADFYEYGDGKSGGATNYGVYKQNQDMISQVYPLDEGRHGTDLNNDLTLDTEVLMASREHFGDDWWAGHRGGQTGLDGNWPQEDLDNYRTAVEWMAAQIDADPERYWSDDTRFWVEVPAV